MTEEVLLALLLIVNESGVIQAPQLDLSFAHARSEGWRGGSAPLWNRLMILFPLSRPSAPAPPAALGMSLPRVSRWHSGNLS